MVLVAVNPAFKKHELDYALGKSGARAVFFQKGYRGHEFAPVLNEVRGDLPDLDGMFPIDELDAFIDRSLDLDLEVTDVDLNAPAILQFTSGTTGRPKGALLHHFGMVNASKFVVAGTAFPDRGTWASAMPIYHVGGVVPRSGCSHIMGLWS